MAQEPGQPAQTPTEHPRVTVEALVAEPTLRGTLVAGAVGLAHEITWCLPLAEALACAPDLHEGDVQDLAGIVVHAPTTRLEAGEKTQRLVDGLARRGAAAVIAWPGRGGEAPSLDAVARAAEKAALPLLKVSREADFRHVSQLLATKVLAQSAHVLEYSQRVHRTLGEVFAHGSGLVAMARTMAHLARTPTVILGLDGQTLAFADVDNPGAQAPAGTDSLTVARLVTRHSLERAAVAASGGEVTHSRVVEIDLDGETVHAVAAPVTVASDPYGAVVLLERDWPPAEHDLAQHRVIAEQGATLVGSELLRQRSVQEAEERARDDFVDALLHGRFTDQHELAARARHYSFNPEGRFAVFVVSPRGLHLEHRSDALRAAAAARAAERVAANPDLLTLTAMTGPMIVVVRQLPTAGHPKSQNQRSEKPDNPPEEREVLRAFAEELRKLMQDRLGPNVGLAYGRAGDGAGGVAASYREARTALALGQRVKAGAEVRVVSGYDELKVFAAIEQVAASTPGRSFAREVLEPLRKLDGQTGNLEEIVLGYIEASGNINEAARRLRLHRNTMLYKLDRASRALQMDIRTAQAQFMVWLAHHIDALAEVRDSLDTELMPLSPANAGPVDSAQAQRAETSATLPASLSEPVLRASSPANVARSPSTATAAHTTNTMP
jgi:sugar diacid utilization regulator